MVDRISGPARQVDLEQVRVRIERQPPQVDLALARRSGIRDEPGGSAARAAADEEQTRPASRGHLLAQVRLHLLGQTASGDGVVTPERSVLDEQPVVDRLAVANSGSSFSRDSSAQNGLALGIALLANHADHLPGRDRLTRRDRQLA